LAGWEKYRLDQKLAQTAAENNNKEARRERDKSYNNCDQKSLTAEISSEKMMSPTRRGKVRDGTERES
jgi:hypothetical protein